MIVPPDIWMTAILVTECPEAGPEVDLKIDHLLDPAASLLLVTESILVTRVETRIIVLIVDLTILMTVTGTIPTMTGTVMTAFMTLTADIMARVVTGLLPTDSHLLQGLMTTVQST